MRVLLFLLALTAAASGLAQEGLISADRLRPAVDREGFLDVQSGRLPPHLAHDVAVFVGYAHAPLVVHEEGSRPDARPGAVVAGRLETRVLANLALLGRFSLGVEVPFVLAQHGDESVAGLDENPVASSGLGDLRLTPKARLLRREEAGLDLAILTSIELPTASPRGGWLGDDDVVLVPQLAASRDLGGVQLGLNVGARLARTRSFIDVDSGSALLVSAGARYRLDDEGLPLGLAFALSGERPTRLAGDGQVGLEALFSADFAIAHSVVVMAGGGAGVFGAPRVPEFRAFAALRYAPRSR